MLFETREPKIGEYQLSIPAGLSVSRYISGKAALNLPAPAHTRAADANAPGSVNAMPVTLAYLPLAYLRIDCIVLSICGDFPGA